MTDYYITSSAYPPALGPDAAGMKAAADELVAALKRLDIPMSAPWVTDKGVRLGEVSVDAADVLALALGGEPQEITDLDDYAQGERVVARLNDAVKRATGVFLGAVYAPNCARCQSPAAVDLAKPLLRSDVESLTAALQADA
ncbi:hypothetical protein [Streptomyces sp. NPDC055036]